MIAYKKPAITLGCDPELMLARTINSEILSAIPIIKQSKQMPVMLGDGMHVYYDNVLSEVSMPPSKSVGEAVDRMRETFCRVQAHIGPEFMMVPKAAHYFDELPPKPDDELVRKWLRDEVPTDAVAPEWQVGCMPNYDAYSGEQRKQSPFQDSMRTGSFHIHIGNVNWEDKHEEVLMTDESKRNAVRLMDIYVGCLSILFDKDPTSPSRKALYGKAGEFRATKYGIEYRVLGNYALMNPELTDLVFSMTQFAMMQMPHDKDIIAAIDEGYVRHAINTCNLPMAKAVLQLANCPSYFLRRATEYQAPKTIAEAWKL